MTPARQLQLAEILIPRKHLPSTSEYHGPPHLYPLRYPYYILATSPSCGTSVDTRPSISMLILPVLTAVAALLPHALAWGAAGQSPRHSPPHLSHMTLTLRFAQATRSLRLSHRSICTPLCKRGFVPSCRPRHDAILHPWPLGRIKCEADFRELVPCTMSTVRTISETHQMIG